jgi:shikimate dehydrogenase
MITGKTKVFAVLGDPITHSLSPVLHNGWLRDLDIDAVYVALNLKSADPASLLSQVQNLGLSGANVTIPYKEAAFLAATICDADVATHFKTANVLAVNASGQLVAHNTDGHGFVQALDEADRAWARGGLNILMLGAGGAARGIALQLCLHLSKQQGAPQTFTIVNRRGEKAHELASALRAAAACKTDVRTWDDAAACVAAADLIINATSLGMTGQPLLLLPLARARDHAIVADIVYAPLLTDLLKEARARHLRCVDGLAMLINQGALAFEIWFGVKPDRVKARTRLMAHLAGRA